MYCVLARNIADSVTTLASNDCQSLWAVLELFLLLIYALLGFSHFDDISGDMQPAMSPEFDFHNLAQEQLLRFSTLVYRVEWPGIALAFAVIRMAILTRDKNYSAVYPG